MVNGTQKGLTPKYQARNPFLLIQFYITKFPPQLANRNTIQRPRHSGIVWVFSFSKTENSTSHQFSKNKICPSERWEGEFSRFRRQVNRGPTSPIVYNLDRRYHPKNPQTRPDKTPKLAEPQKPSSTSKNPRLSQESLMTGSSWQFFAHGIALWIILFNLRTIAVPFKFS